MTEDRSNDTLTAAIFADREVASCLASGPTLARFLDFEIALTASHLSAGGIEETHARAAMEQMATFKPGVAAILQAQEKDGLPVPEFVRQLKRHCGPHAGAVHIGATSQDLMDTAIMLGLRQVNAILSERLTSLIAAIETLLQEQGNNDLMGRTRMQVALPVFVRNRVLPWQTALAKARDDLAAIEGGLYVLQLGGPVGRGVVEDTHRRQAIVAHMAEALDLSVATHVWHADRSIIVAYGQWLTRLTGALGKIGLDIALMAQQGIDAVTIRGGGGSSAMPHKQNPILAEKLVSLARHNNALGAALGEAMIHESERSGMAWMMEWLTLPQMAECTGRALGDALALIASIETIGNS